jgi:hypothetical protein
MKSLRIAAAVGFAAAVVMAYGAPARAADVTVLGCNEGNAGVIGVRELLGDVGDTVGVAVTVHTVAAVAEFGLDLAFPTQLLTYVRTDPGSLTAGRGWPIRGTFRPAEGVVRIGGLDPSAIPAGTTGSLAVVQFEVTAPGMDTFATRAFLGDLTGYDACNSSSTPTHINFETWSGVKALYR